MKKFITLAICLMIFQANFAQAPGTITTVEDVYGGRINAITGGKLGSAVSDSFRVIVATESANSIFYATGIFPSLGTVSIGSFTALSSANAAAGYGSSISKIAYHKTSQTIYFIASGNIYATTTSAATATKLTTTNNYTDIKVSGNNFFALTTSGTNNSIYAYSIDALGTLTLSSSSSSVGMGYTNIVIGKNDYLYLFKSGTDPFATKFDTTITTGVNLSSSSSDALASLSSAYSWDAMGVYTDGTVFVGGTNGGTNPYKYVANITTFGSSATTTTVVATGINGTSGSNIEFRTGLLGNYYVYFGTSYSSAKGAATTWNTLGNAGLVTHPNDGYVQFFNENIATGGILLLTTDAGLGMTKNSGSVIKDINTGILATQVEDFDMNSSKTFGWLAAKDGIRYVNNYNTAAKAWTASIWPNGDGSPYYSAEMVGNDTMKAFVGNLRIYKTVDKGSSWTRMFTPENAPYSFPSVGVRAEAIAVSSYDTNFVMAGYYNQNSGQYGGVFYSTNGGNTWSQLLIRASVAGQDINVNDIEMTYDSGKIVAYIGVEYYNTSYKGMYKAQWNGASWSVSEEPIYGGTGVKYSVTDIIIPSKDTIVAVGAFYNSVLGHTYPIYFNISRPVTNSWRSTVVDTNRNGTYTACAWNRDTIFYAYNNKIYYDIISFHSASTSRVGEALYANVDNGTEINVLYYDELLVGSSTGFRNITGASEIYSEPGNPVISISADRTTICANQNVIFTAITDNVGLGAVYTWKINGVATGGNAPTLTTNALPNNASVSCTVMVDGVSATSNTVTITVNTNPFVSPITGTSSTCQINTTTSLSNATSGGVWSSSNSGVATVSATGIVTSVGTGNTTIQYTVTNTNGCSNAMSIIFNVAPQPIPAIGGLNSVCVGNNITLTNLAAGTTAVWSSLAGRATVNNNGVVTGTSAGTATIKLVVTNAFGCTNTSSVNISVGAAPAIPSVAYAPGTVSPQTTSVGGVITLCKNRNFTLVGNPVGGSWSSTNSAAITINSLGQVATVGLGTAAVSYTITAANGCTSSKTFNANVVNCASKQAIANNKSEVLDFIIYPNPAKNFVHIQLKNTDAASKAIVYDLLGKQVKQQNLSIGNNTIDVTNCAKGIYLIAVEMNGERKVQKLVIE